MFDRFFTLQIKGEPKPYFSATKKKARIEVPNSTYQVITQLLIDEKELNPKKIPADTLLEAFQAKFFSPYPQNNIFVETLYCDGLSEALTTIFKYVSSTFHMSIQENSFKAGKPFVKFAEDFSKKSNKNLSESPQKYKILKNLDSLISAIENRAEIYSHTYGEDSDELLKLKTELLTLLENAVSCPDKLKISSIYKPILDNWETWIESKINYYSLLLFCAASEKEKGNAAERAMLRNLINTTKIPQL